MIENLTFEKDATGVARLDPDSDAATCIAFLPAGELQNKLIDLEAKYEAFMWHRPGKPTLRSRLAWWIAGPALRAIRAEVAQLAKDHQKLLLSVQAQPIAENFGAEYHRLTKDLRDFRLFLASHFEKDLDIAEGRNTPLLELAKQIMLR